MPELERIYRAAPVRVQNWLTNLQGWRINRARYGHGFDSLERAVEKRWELEGQALIDFQAARLRSHLLAAMHSAFWRQRFADAGVNVRASDPFAELAKLPVLTKAEVQGNAESLLGSHYRRSALRSAHTSGTTGAGLRLWETADAERERWAVWWRYRKQFGLTRKTRNGHFGGRSVVPIEQSKPPYWRFNRPGSQLLFSAYHLSEATVKDYHAALTAWRAEWLHGYPSVLALFAELCLAAGLPPLPTVSCITAGAENLLASQRTKIEAAFGRDVRHHYGLTESVANISERRDGCMYVDEDFSFVEFLESRNEGSLRIVGTNWSNPAFPLFRYETGDLAATSDLAAASGRWRKVDGIDGRSEDYVVMPTGARIGRLDHIFKDLDRIREAQIYQPKHDHLVFRVVKGPGYDEERVEARLLQEARIRLGDGLQLDIDYMDEIPRTASGKLRLVVSDLRAGSLDSDARSSFKPNGEHF